MNFLAHSIMATRFLTPKEPLPAYVVGTALPDLLPLAASRVRLRPAQVTSAETRTEFEEALAAGVSAHLVTDAAFHKTAAFAEAQAEISALLAGATFEGMRIRRFFVTHVLTELMLDAVLLRADPALADRFYEAFAAADFDAARHWTEKVTAKSLPLLPYVLGRFADTQYLRQYAEDEGVATGLSNLCRRARQDGFEGENLLQLAGVVSQAAARMPRIVPALFSETAAGIVDCRGEHGVYLTEVKART